MSYYVRREKTINLNITLYLIIINAVVFVAASLILSQNPEFIKYLAIQPLAISQLKNLWTIITSMFMHANLTHLLVNMISLMFIGSFVERIIGRKRFVWFYIISGIIAGLFFVGISLALNSNVETFAVGASGALFALGGLLAILTPKLRVLVFFIIPMPMWIAMIFLLGVLWILSLTAGLPIGNLAHLGGLLCGLVYGIYLRKKYPRKTKRLSKFFA